MPFDAKYIAMYGPAIIEATDEIFKILPCPLARMSRPYRYVNSASACMLSCHHLVLPVPVGVEKIRPVSEACVINEMVDRNTL